MSKMVQILFLSNFINFKDQTFIARRSLIEKFLHNFIVRLKFLNALRLTASSWINHYCLSITMIIDWGKKRKVH